MRLEKEWGFEEALEIITEAHPPGGTLHGPQRNRLIEAWGQLVGRTRALAELDLAIEENGSITALGRKHRITARTLKGLKEFYAGLPDDRGRADIYPGLRLGQYRLIGRLGSGGNAEVWRAKSQAQQSVALKILKHPKGGSLKRFTNEIGILKQLKRTPGILPLIDSVPLENEDIGRYAWLALPIAKPILSSIPNNGNLTDLVLGINTIAKTLANLHQQGISHRDVKPDNLYLWEGTWVISDFGIASFPNKESLTVANKKLGPLHYIAPEMLTAVNTADGAKADVYSLAKTLWVLLTGQSYPPPGEQRKDVELMRVSTWVPLPESQIIDELLEQATRHAPASRPSMNDFREKLDEWLNRSNSERHA